MPAAPWCSPPRIEGVARPLDLGFRDHGLDKAGSGAVVCYTMSTKQDWNWLPQWAPTFAVLVALLAAVVPAAFYLGGELARLDQGQADLKAELSSLEARLETRLDALFAELREIRAELREDRREHRAELSKVQDDLAAVSERVAVLEAGKES